MIGDGIRVEEHHRAAARLIARKLLPEINGRAGRYVLAVAGESGSGTAETAEALVEALAGEGIASRVYRQVDYLLLPPRLNDAKRRADITRVGTREVRLDLLDRHLDAARHGDQRVRKPLVIEEEDRISEETVDLNGIRVVIAEGTYATLLKNVDTKIFIERSRLEMPETRRRCAQDAADPFIEDVLEIEQHIIGPHKLAANVVITKDYDVHFTE